MRRLSNLRLASGSCAISSRTDSTLFSWSGISAEEGGREGGREEGGREGGGREGGRVGWCFAPCHKNQRNTKCNVETTSIQNLPLHSVHCT